MKILITGGLGFQGVHLASALIRAGHDVTLLNTMSADAQTNLGHLKASFVTLDQAPIYQVVWGSVTDPEIVRKTVFGQRRIIHLAAWASVDLSFVEPAAALHVNVLGTYNVLEAVRLRNRQARVVVASSCEVYGDTGGNPAIRQSPEFTPLMPHSPYAATKAAADRLAYAYRMTYDLDITIVRPANVYGPYQRSGMGGAVIPIMVDAAVAGLPITVTGDGLQTREYLHVDDLVRGYLAILDGPSGVYNLGTGEIVTIQSIAERIAATFGVPIEHVVGRPGEVQGFRLDSMRMAMLHGFMPRISFADGLLSYLAWRKSQAT